MTPRLKTKYQEEIAGNLKTEFGYTNDHQIPKITKVVLRTSCVKTLQLKNMLQGIKMVSHH